MWVRERGGGECERVALNWFVHTHTAVPPITGRGRAAVTETTAPLDTERTTIRCFLIDSAPRL